VDKNGAGKSGTGNNGTEDARRHRLDVFSFTIAIVHVTFRKNLGPHDTSFLHAGPNF